VPPASAVKSRIDKSGLKFTAKNENGTESLMLDFSRYPGSVGLRQQVVRAFARLNGPDGRWRETETCKSAHRSVRQFLAWCQKRRLTDLEAFRVGDWNALMEDFRSQKAGISALSRNHALSRVRAVILSQPGLDEVTKQAVAARYMEPENPGAEERDFYEVDQIEEFKKQAYLALCRAHRRIGANWELVQQDEDCVDASDRTRWEALQMLLDHGFGDMTNDHYQAIGAMKRLGAWTWPLKRLAWRALFLTTDEALAAVVALMCETGENSSTLQRRTAPSTAATAADEGVTVLHSSLDKPRRGARRRYMTENAGTSRSLGRRLALVAELTEPSRERLRRVGGVNADRLIWFVNCRNGVLQNDIGALPRVVMAKEPTWVPGDGAVNLQKLRRSVVTRVLARPHHHEETTFIREYAMKDPKRKAEMQKVAARGLQNLFDTAQQTFVKLLSHEEAQHAGLLAGGPERYLTPTGMGCTDCDHNPRTGKPCDDPWLACLGCSNAFAVDDHLPLLVCLFDMLEGLRQTAREATWRSRYALAWARLTLILKDLSHAQWDWARQRRADDITAQVTGAVRKREYEI